MLKEGLFFLSFLAVGRMFLLVSAFLHLRLLALRNLLQFSLEEPLVQQVRHRRHPSVALLGDQV